WEPGWALLSEIGGNLATITARSFGVRDGVKSGRFGIGLVVDFFGLSGKAVGAPVDFLYPDGTIFLPANAAIVRRSSNPSAARAFIDFLRSKAGQKILLEPAISRLPVSESIYQHAAPGYPNPFESELLKKGIAFDSQLSRQRYHLVNTLFDLLITYRFSSLRKSWSAIHESEAQLADDADALSRIDIGRARQLLGAVPVSEAKSRDPAINSVFSRRNPGLPVSDQQLDLEKQWYSFIQKNHQLAMQLVTNVLESNHQQ
ncbi:MAG: ABC transporter substrate-binding protein, partial [Gammaproteobacteria bacterium]|nr:ABC transporter substrate-binding protein [Gammaproteobacteria bacterium]